jgi:anti-sigma regulatory factor (Ser/Thr protein kinase)
MPMSRVYDLGLAVSEAAANVVKHAGGGDVCIGITRDRVRVLVEDHGPGMDSLTLPQLTLQKGYSTKRSMGMGFSLILSMVDTVYLSTQPGHTLVMMEKLIREPKSEVDLETLPDTW